MILGQLKMGEHQVNYRVLTIVIIIIIILSTVKQLISETADDISADFAFVGLSLHQTVIESSKCKKLSFDRFFSCDPDIWWASKQVTATRCIEPPL